MHVHPNDMLLGLAVDPYMNIMRGLTKSFYGKVQLVKVAVGLQRVVSKQGQALQLPLYARLHAANVCSGDLHC